jgi:hypothetical protein
MGRSRLPAALLPPGLIIEHVQIDESGVGAVARSRESRSMCPDCGEPSSRIHSRYARSLSDLPAYGRRVRIALAVRRFRCGNERCPRVIFAERFRDDIVAPYSRRTARLQSIIHHLGLALGGRPGQGLARRLLMPVSKDTLLRVVRARAPEAKPVSRVIGIDDWAWKRGHRYGTIVCDLERRKIVDLLPDREAATVEAWLADHPTVEIVSRDRGGGYPFVDANNAGIARTAVDHLADLGHRRIALLNGPEPRAYSSERLRGFRETVAARGLDSNPRLVRAGDTSEAYGRTATRELLSLDRRPTAVVCCNSLVAVGVYEALKAAGLDVPRDVSVVAHDDLLPQAETANFDPPLTITRLGLQAAFEPLASLFVRLAVDDPIETLFMELSAEFVVRLSTAPSS